MQEGTTAEQDQQKVREPAKATEHRGGHLSIQMRGNTDQCGKIERQPDGAVDHADHRRPAPGHPDRADQAEWK